MRSALRPVFVGVVVIAAAFALLYLVAVVATRGGGDSTSGEVFRAGEAEVLSVRIAAEGPVLYAGLQRDLDVWLNHLGADHRQGWVAFAARPDGAIRDCNIVWRPSDGDFIDPCTGTTYPADGQGLKRFPVDVDTDDRVRVNLNSSLASSATATTGAG